MPRTTKPLCSSCRAAVNEHWQAGLEDFTRSVNHPEWLRGSTLAEGIRVYDLTR